MSEQQSGTIMRVAKVTTGVALLPIGVAMLVLPGPGIPVVLASLALLRGEFRWADRVLTGAEHWAKRGLGRLQGKPEPEHARDNSHHDVSP